jgi:Uma2 family endonuclease
MTAEDLAALPDDGLFYELDEGRLIRMSPAGGSHGRIGSRIVTELQNWADEHQAGAVYQSDTGFVLSRQPDTVRAPDAAYIVADRVPEEDTGFLELAPDLAVEVISPSNTAQELATKVVQYLDAGAQEVWVVDPNNRLVTIYTPDGTARTLRERDVIADRALLPGFRLAVSDLFRKFPERRG